MPFRAVARSLSGTVGRSRLKSVEAVPRCYMRFVFNGLMPRPRQRVVIAQMDDHFDIDKFISLVKTKESVWNYKSTVYSNKLQRIDDWMSICENMVEDFNEKTTREKNVIVHEYQAKWKVLRDGFTRFLKNYKRKSESGTAPISRGRYAYSKQLQFLNDLYGCQNVFVNDEEPTVSNRQERKRQKQNITEISLDDLNDEVPEPKKANMDANASNNTENSGMDEDKQFLLSLLSDFKKIHEDQKLDAKGDIINVIRHYRSTPNSLSIRGTYYSNNIAALVTTATERPESQWSDSCEYAAAMSPTEIKFISSCE